MAPLPSAANPLGIGGLTTPDLRSLNSAPLFASLPFVFCTWILSCCQLRLCFCFYDLFLFSDCWSLPRFPEIITKGGLFLTPLPPSPAAAAAKLLHSCLTLCDPMGCSLSGSSVHGDSPGKNTGVGCHALLQGFFPAQESNRGLLHCRQILYHWDTRASCPLQIPNRNL